MKKLTIIALMSLIFSNLSFAQTKLTDEQKKNIEKATPEPLPQTPVAPKLKSDAEDENFKGKVKTVVYEAEYFTGPWVSKGRWISSIRDFNETGNFLKYIVFFEEDWFVIEVYGYIDGARVSNNQIFNKGTIPKLEYPPPIPGSNMPKRDLRYSYKYEYEYIDGKLAETQNFYNDGKKGMRYVYNYSKNQLETLTYDGKDVLIGKSKSVYDNNGNEIEFYTISVSNPPEADKKHVIKYKSFDKRGNWTERTYLKVEIENGKEVLTPIYTYYRTITYYP